MKKLYPKGNGAVFKLCVILLITATAIIYGCKKEISRNKDATSIPAEKTIADAKAWYENTYRAGSSGQPVHTNSTGTGIDLSQSIKPDWEHAANYSRLGKDVIEMPVDPDSKFGTILKKKVNNHAYSKTYTRSSFLLLKGPKGYQAYIMTIIADSSYIKNDPAKLANNTYRQHDADFSGLVLYFTPKGKYVNGYAYQNGQLVTSASQVQSSGKTQVQLARICTDWYADVYVDNVLVASVYLYTTCTGEQDPGNSGSPAPPDPCIIVPPPPTTPPPATPNPPSTPPTGPIIPQAIPGGYFTVNNVPGGGGGFPPPFDDDDPCVINPQDIINKIKDPCLKAMVAAAIKSDIVFDINQTMNGIFNTNTDFNIEFTDDALVTNLDGATDVLQAGGIPAAPNSSRIILNTLSLKITLNSSTLPSASKEYITATILHEVLHAYFIESHVTFDHQVMFEQYIPWYTSILKTMYPGMDPNDTQALAYGGLQDAPSYIGSLTSLQKQSYKEANDRYKSGASGTPCTK